MDDLVFLGASIYDLVLGLKGGMDTSETGEASTLEMRLAT